MKLTLQIKLLPTQEEFTSLKKTLIEANTACNEISDTAFTKKIYNQYKLHHETYHRIKNSFNLSAQMVVRCISKVCDAYKLDRKVKREFRQLGAITYDARILSYSEDSVSLWSVDGRLKGVKFVCHNPKYIPYIKGEADLVLKKGKFYIFQTVEAPEEDVKDIESFIGCDFGINSIITTSDGINHSAEWLNAYREHRQKVRSSIQAKADTSKRSIGKRNNKSFKCENCGHNEDADFNASKNIATLGSAVNQSEKSAMYCSIALHRSGLKPIGL